MAIAPEPERRPAQDTIVLPPTRGAMDPQGET